MVSKTERGRGDCREEEDGSDERGLVGGERKEGERKLGWLGGDLGQLVPGCDPVGLCPSSFFFFCSISFLLFF
jgi:hypothetical protein